MRSAPTARIRIRSAPRGRVSTQSLPDVERTRHAGHRAASGSSVTSCTILTPSPVTTTRSTANPASHSEVGHGRGASVPRKVIERSCWSACRTAAAGRCADGLLLDRRGPSGAPPVEEMRSEVAAHVRLFVASPGIGSDGMSARSRSGLGVGPSVRAAGPVGVEPLTASTSKSKLPNTC